VNLAAEQDESFGEGHCSILRQFLVVVGQVAQSTGFVKSTPLSPLICEEGASVVLPKSGQWPEVALAGRGEISYAASFPI